MKPVARSQLAPVYGGSWETWHQEAPEAAQVALDGAMERLAHDPHDPGASWAATAVGAQSRPPLLWLPDHMEPDISWELLAACRGDILQTGKRRWELGIMWTLVEGGKGWLGVSSDAAHPVYYPGVKTINSSNQARKILIKPFWLAQTPLTWSQLHGLVKQSQSGVVVPSFGEIYQHFPANQLRLSELEHIFFSLTMQSLPSLRLPTADEWEWAARGPDGRPYPWGSAPLDAQRAWYGQPYSDGPAPVKRYPRGCGPFGNYDLLGNIAERTSDGVLMGGTHYARAEDLRVWVRQRVHLGQGDGWGVRLVWEPSGRLA